MRISKSNGNLKSIAKDLKDSRLFDKEERRNFIEKNNRDEIIKNIVGSAALIGVSTLASLAEYDYLHGKLGFSRIESIILPCVLNYLPGYLLIRAWTKPEINMSYIFKARTTIDRHQKNLENRSSSACPDYDLDDLMEDYPY